MVDREVTPPRHSGFTLIELVMVIVILGILAVAALPRFADFRKDSNVAVLQAMGGAIKSAAGIVHTKALIKGIQDQQEAYIDLDGDGIEEVQVSYGYPSASRTEGIYRIMDGNFASDWTWSTTYGDTRFWLTTASLGGRSGVYVNQTAVRNSGCYILYDPATAPGDSPTISYVTTDC